MDFQELDRRAVVHTVELVDAIRDDQWDLPTPCAGWTLRRLLAHMTAQHVGFAAAADGETADESGWTEHDHADPRSAHADAAKRVLASFSAPDVMSRELWLPEVRRVGGFPARMAISFHLIDYVVHGWDVAAATGQQTHFDDEVLAAAVEVTRRVVPVGPSRSQPGSSFAPPLVPVDGAPLLDQLLRLLGRSPSWPS